LLSPRVLLHASWSQKRREEKRREEKREEMRELVREELRALLTNPDLTRTLRNPFVGTVFPFAAGMACTTVTGPGSSTANKLTKWLDTGCNLVDSAVTESSGNVGIGTATPTYILELTRNVNSNATQILISNPNNGKTARVGLVTMLVGSNAFDLASDYASTWLRSFFSKPLHFYTNNTLWMTLTAAGNLGIGTSNPTERLDVAGTVKAQGIMGPLRVRVTNASFSTAAGEDHGTGSFAAGDGGMEAQTGTDTGSYDETIGGLITFNSLTQTAGVTSGLNSDGAFLSARARWNSGTIGTNDKFWILAGGVDNSEKLRNGWGFKARDTSGTKKLYGIVRLNGSETAEVDLSTTLAAGTWLDLYAVVRSGAVDFYVNGVLKNTASTTLPSTAASTYEVRVENGAGTNNAILQVAYLTVGLPV
jgi:hypothetical protein